MTTHPSTSNSQVPDGLPAGLPDLETLVRLANEMFASLPDGASASPHIPGGVPVSPEFSQTDVAGFAVPPGTYPGGGSAPGAPPSPATMQPSSSDVPSSLDDAPLGPAAAPPTSSLSVPPLTGVVPVLGALPTVARPVLNPSTTYYFINESLAPSSATDLGSVPDVPAGTAPTADLPTTQANVPAGTVPGAELPAAPGGMAALPSNPAPNAMPSPPGPASIPSSPYYFLGEASTLPSYGLPGEAELRAFLGDVEAPGGAAAPEVTVPTDFQAPGIESKPDTPSARYFVADPAAIPVVAPDPHPPFDLHAIRRDFPILTERVNGKQLVWFDNAATTQKPQAVIDRLAYFYQHENSNIHRAAHELAARATDAYEAARSKVARFIGAGSAAEIIFVRGTTEAINLVAQSWGRQNLREGDEIVISHLEHHANIVPWQLLASEKGFKIRVIPVDDDGQILLDEYRKLLNDRTKLVSVTQVSNALGTITPAKKIVELAHRAGALALIDGAQSVSHMRTNMQDLDADFFVFSGHKIYGPTGIGVVYGKSAVLEDMPPYQGGGNMIADVTLERSMFQPPPGRFEAGTGNIADAVGLGAALDYLERLGIENVAQYEHDLLVYATHRMKEVSGLHLIGTAPDKTSVLSFVLDSYRTDEVGQALSREGIAVRAGHHCAQPILRRFGLETTVRPSLAVYNTCSEVDQMVDVLHRLAGEAGRGRR
jgi:cysteine desulfurase / selenocysteine lyase